MPRTVWRALSARGPFVFDLRGGPLPSLFSPPRPREIKDLAGKTFRNKDLKPMPVVKELATFLDLSFFCRTKAYSEATGVLTMARVIAEHCIETQDTASADVCPADYIQPNKNTAYNAAK